MAASNTSLCLYYFGHLVVRNTREFTPLNKFHFEMLAFRIASLSFNFTLSRLMTGHANGRNPVSAKCLLISVFLLGWFQKEEISDSVP
jgi:hypothetical protein